MSVNQPKPNPTKPSADRGTHSALALLIVVPFALIGFRWFNECHRTHPAELRSESQASHPIELNHASRSELLQLPGVGPGRVDKILAYREAHGGFQRVEDLRGVEGIGDITLQP